MSKMIRYEDVFLIDGKIEFMKPTLMCINSIIFHKLINQ